jgi:hypothetical protein
MMFFQGVDHKFMVNWNFNKQLFWNGRQQILCTEPMHEIHFKHLFGWLMKPNI